MNQSNVKKAQNEKNEKIIYNVYWFVLHVRENSNLHIIEGHEHSKGAQVVAGAHSVFRVGLHNPAASSRPRPSTHSGIPVHTGVAASI